MTDDLDPAAPGPSEVGPTADLGSARILANIGAIGWGAEGAMVAMTGAPIPFDLARAQAFLAACRAAHVAYGLGAKVPFFGAVPGRDFQKVDCSGFVREAVRLSTTPSLPFPDGSVVQHDWIQGRGFALSSIADGKLTDGLVRIAFLSPRDSGHNIGHVVLIANGATLESRGGIGPVSLPWDGAGWQAKAAVYLLGRDVRHGVVEPAIAMAVAPAAASGTITLRYGHRYRATVVLSRWESAFADNAMIASRFQGYGFANVTVTGSGEHRQAEGTWMGPDRPVPADPHITDIVELPAAPIAATPAVAAPAMVTPRPAEHRMPNISARVFTTEALPAYHEGLLVVRMRHAAVHPTVAMATSAAEAPPTSGLSAVSFFERAGLLKGVVPLRSRKSSAIPPGMPIPAVATMTVRDDSLPDTDVSGHASFLQMEPGHERQLHMALASDPSVESVSRVPVRYLLAGRARTVPGEPSIEAVPPAADVLWNLQKIRWRDARARPGFTDATSINVAVLDTGVDDQHPSLRVAGYHWQNPDLTVPVSSQDLIGHGTHVSGTIAALITAADSVKGICQCRLSVWKIFDDTPTYIPSLGGYIYVVNPILYRRALAGCLDAPVDVINLSIGGPGVPDKVEQSLFDQLVEAGVTICAAMGNERQSGSPTSYPAALPGVIAVGATGLDDAVTIFSNFGNHISVCAPGKAIWSTLPRYPGQTGFYAALGSDGQPRQGLPMAREVDFDAWDGTSMATPHVSGAAALWIAKRVAAGQKPSPADVRQALASSADKVGGMNGADFTVDYGAGRINLMTLLS